MRASQNHPVTMQQQGVRVVFAEGVFCTGTCFSHHSPHLFSTASATPVVTIEYQRQQAKEMQKYFRRMALEEEVAKAQYVYGVPVHESVRDAPHLNMHLNMHLNVHLNTSIPTQGVWVD